LKVLLTHGYFIHDDPKEQVIMRPYVPLGILYISTYLEQNAVAHEVFDSTFSNKQAQIEFIEHYKPDYIGIYVNLMTKVNVLQVITSIKNNPRLKHIPIILGGPEVRNHADKLLQHGADYIVLGEGEISFYELINALDKGHDILPITGICYLNAVGEIIKTGEREKIKDLDLIGIPNRKKVNLQLYLDAWKQHHGKNAISISTMRGCPYTCKWCSRAVYGLSYRRRSPEHVLEEMIHLQQTYNPDSLWFVDDVFTVSHKWMETFATLVELNGIKLPYECITRADRLNEEVLSLLQRSGCFRVWIGAESGSQKIIDAMDRRVDVEQVRNMIQLAKKFNIETGTFIMLGYPGEDESDIEETIHHLKTSNPDYFTITIAYPIKGTALYEEVEPNFTTQLDWTNSSDREIKFKRTYPERYYRFAVSRVVNEVNYFKHAQLKYKVKSMVAKSGMWLSRTLLS
jgi:anaerobic magnesium-protoporphyrin IX monomethyl ester cyclase